MSEYDASNRLHVKAAAKDARLEDRQRGEIIGGIMSLPAGRRWMLGVLEACHVFASSFSRNALDMAFSEGERNVGLRLLNDIMQYHPTRYVEMMNERSSRDAAADARRRNAPATDPDGGDQGPSGGNAEADGPAEGATVN